MAGAPPNEILRQSYEAVGLWSGERLGWLLHQAARRWPDREFILYEGTRYTYERFCDWVDLAARGLLDLGVRRSDRVLVLLPNCMEALVYQVAAFRIGAVVSPVVPIYREHELRQILDDLRPRAVVVAAELKERRPPAEIDRMVEEGVASVDVKVCVGADVPGWARAVAFPASGAHPDTGDFPEPLASDETTLILYTSGTTARPKGVRLSSRAILSQARTWRLELNLNAETVVVCLAPLSHLAGFINGLLLPASLGARTVLLPAWEPDTAIELIAAENATFACGAAVFLLDLVSRYETSHRSEPRIRLFLCGGSAVPPALIERADALGIGAFRAYGMGETAGTITLSRPDGPLDRRSTTDGRVSAGTQVQAVDENRNLLPYGDVGEIRVRSPQLMLGYTNPALTALQVDEEGWFYTGDLGSVDEAGWLQIRGRLKDIINRGAEKFSSQDIEEAIFSHPDIARVAVVGVPDERLGEAVAAFLTLEPHATWSGPEPILAHLERLAMSKSKWPVEWQVLDSLPTNPSGKVQKNRLLELRAAALQERGTR